MPSSRPKVRFLEKQEKVIALENDSLREDLLFMNVPEQTEQEGENCADNIYDIIENELNIDVENLKFHAIHRVEKSVYRIRHRKLIQGLSLHAFYAERTEIWYLKRREAAKLFTTYKRVCC